ncbi:hypothetical protein Q4567_05805 [Aliiglaciecola sp. 2_MG-2023]|uniref:hypothetical protein n=1 Tax=Alteromonadaceae TaxID=72275 RepID=UPI0026E1221D|nr:MULTISPECIES: hypothetical protein [unclassified Aliiglaciecola]MDO6710228.1 hypothetical protein [Aliiglaciecola sp. 2_MG-2023]MDO6751376.1 hypothetical protein [Aliiglaciecola sp. 1_MG-2023]
MKSRRVHKVLGLLLVLPMIGWVITGLIFFIKPGYQDAYEQLAIKTYPLEQSFVIPNSTNWIEARVVKTILGHHLLVKTAQGFEHLDPDSYLPKTLSEQSELHTLVNDAVLHNPQRYGNVVSSDGYKAKTNTGVEVNLNWNRLTLSQSGGDTKLINTLYKIHYLQWTPFKEFNQILGFSGLILLLLLTILGIKIYLSSKGNIKINRG